jgi:hypothetical protein
MCGQVGHTTKNDWYMPTLSMIWQRTAKPEWLNLFPFFQYFKVCMMQSKTKTDIFAMKPNK